jgi:RNA polymerase sigma factor (sigma-70 family)
MPAWGADARYTRIVQQHANTLLYLAVLLTGNRHDAEDVVQDVLISVASAWPVAKPLAYLRRSVANRCVDLVRSRRELPSDALPEQGYDDEGFLRHERDRRFFELVQQLPDRQRQTLVLRYYADLDDPAIAKILGVTRETVRSQAHHGLEKLRAREAELLTEENS